jgi:hypothetical protein
MMEDGEPDHQNDDCWDDEDGGRGPPHPLFLKMDTLFNNDIGIPEFT